MNKLLKPKSIAIIGASPEKNSVGLSLYKNAKNNKTGIKVYPVNIKERKILGTKSYKSILDIKDSIDLAVVAVPAKIVPAVMHEIAMTKTKNVLIITAGFSEIGREGEKLAKKIEQIAKKNNIRVMGPNCLGFINPQMDLNMSFASRSAKKGNVALISQSGAICTALLDWSDSENIGFSNFVSIGSMMDVSHSDLIEYFDRDKATKSIVIYMEGINNPDKFITACKKTKKSIYVLKSGKTEEGSGAVKSHTGSLAGSDQAMDALFRQAGVKRLNNIEELFDIIKIESSSHKISSRLAIVTNAGGPGVISTDALSLAGGKLAKLSKQSKEKLDKVLPSTWSKANPIDLIGDASPSRYANTLKILIKDKNIDSIFVLLSPQDMTEPEKVAKFIKELKLPAKKYLFAAFIGGTDLLKAKEIMRQSGIAVFDTPERAVRAFVSASSEKSVSRDGAFREVFSDLDLKRINKIIDKAKDEKRDKLNEKEVKELLSHAGAPVLKSSVVKKITEIDKLRGIKYPLAMKISSADILHKVDCGGVELMVENKAEAKKAFSRIIRNVKKFHPKANIEGVYMETMIDTKLELVLGLSKDPVLGNIIMFGRGGTELELMQDVSFGVLPMSRDEILKMMQETKVYTLLEGYRGSEAFDKEKIIELIVTLQSLALEFPELKEMDINPLALNNQGMWILDGKLVIS